MKTLTTFILGLILVVFSSYLLYCAFNPERALWDRILKGIIGLISLCKAYDKIEKSTY